jgi:amino acid adenylation domain-containing protein
VAVEHEGIGTTYRELEERSNQLARFLRRVGVGPEIVVGVAADRSPELVTGLLATLKAGGAYLPLDPDYPPERLAWMLEDSRAPLLLTRRHLASRWPEARTVLLDGGEWEAEDSASPPWDVEPGNAAYVLYTSGSTGRPKGVVVEHRSLAAYALDAARAYGLASGERALQFASISFDTSAEEIYPALVTGATLVLRPESMLDSVPRFLTELERLGITVLNLPTAYWHELAAGLESRALPRDLRRVILGGERALPEALVQWRRVSPGHPARLVNTYGPTETTIVATRHELADVIDPAMGISIGRPIPGARVYVVDRRLQPVLPGAAGELLVGGAGLSRGYLGRPDLTAASFVPDPFGEIPGDRLYRTGDLVRFRVGALEFLGRIDGQVKIRGFRVETGEIESVLTAHPRIQSVAVTLREDAPGGPGLVAYVVPAGESGAEPPTTSELRRFLADRLPEHMVPAAFMILESLPRTGSGKVDRRALPRPDGERPRLAREYVPPVSEVEEALVEIWAETLGIERVGVQDNFFELGGHSLLATQVITRIRERLRIDLPLIALFQMPTVEQLAVVVEEKILDILEAMEDAEVQALVGTGGAP